MPVLFAPGRFATFDPGHAVDLDDRLRPAGGEGVEKPFALLPRRRGRVANHPAGAKVIRRPRRRRTAFRQGWAGEFRGKLATARSIWTHSGASASISAVSLCPACIAIRCSCGLRNCFSQLGTLNTSWGMAMKSPWRRRISRQAICRICGWPPWPLIISSLRKPAR